MLKLEVSGIQSLYELLYDKAILDVSLSYTSGDIGGAYLNIKRTFCMILVVKEEVDPRHNCR